MLFRDKRENQIWLGESLGTSLGKTLVWTSDLLLLCSITQSSQLILLRWLATSVSAIRIGNWCHQKLLQMALFYCVQVVVASIDFGSLARSLYEWVCFLHKLFVVQCHDGFPCPHLVQGLSSLAPISIRRICTVSGGCSSREAAEYRQPCARPKNVLTIPSQLSLSEARYDGLRSLACQVRKHTCPMLSFVVFKVILIPMKRSVVLHRILRRFVRHAKTAMNPSINRGQTPPLRRPRFCLVILGFVEGSHHFVLLYQQKASIAVSAWHVFTDLVIILEINVF